LNPIVYLRFANQKTFANGDYALKALIAVGLQAFSLGDIGFGGEGRGDEGDRFVVKIVLALIPNPSPTGRREPGIVPLSCRIGARGEGERCRRGVGREDCFI
jgi:hypothetical protein